MSTSKITVSTTKSAVSAIKFAESNIKSTVSTINIYHSPKTVIASILQIDRQIWWNVANKEFNSTGYKEMSCLG